MKYAPPKKDQISFFPKIQDDESAYSIISRLDRRMGLPGSRATLDALFGSQDIAVTSDFPSVIPILSQYSGMSTEEFASKHTILPFYRPFLSEPKYRQVIKAMDGEHSNSVFAHIAQSANRVAQNDSFQWCPECVIADKARVGTSYWRCSHQLPGISVCPVHGVRLACLPKSRRTLTMPPNDATSEFLPVECAEFKYAVLAGDCHKSSWRILNNRRRITTYFSEMEEHGLVTPGGRIRDLELSNRIYRYWDGIWDRSPFSDFLDVTRGLSPLSIFRRPDCHHHPIKHFLLIGMLFGTWETFTKCYISQSPKRPSKYSDTKPESPQPVSKTYAEARGFLARGKSLRYVASKTGISVGTARVLAEQDQVPIRTRPSKISAELRREIWRKLYVGMDTQVIAREFGLSCGAIEQILRCHPILAPLRKRIRLYRIRESHRVALKETIEANPSYSRKQIRETQYKAYTWLYRNDRDWLYQQLPAPIPRNQRPVKSKYKQYVEEIA